MHLRPAALGGGDLEYRCPAHSGGVLANEPRTIRHYQCAVGP